MRRKKDAKNAVFASFLELFYRAEELKYAEHDADKAIQIDQTAYDTYEDVNYRNDSEYTDEDRCDSAYNDENDELNDKRGYVLLFDLEGSGPEFFNHIHIYLPPRKICMNELYHADAVISIFFSSFLQKNGFFHVFL
jgi:hypothetical protein